MNSEKNKYQKLDPQAEKLLQKWSKEGNKPAYKLSAKDVRLEDKEVQELQEPLEEVQDIINLSFSRGDKSNLNIRIFKPYNVAPPFPIIIYFHGGGFVIGHESYESPLRKLTNESGHMICSVEYRLAPENKYPAAIEDAYDTVVWLLNNLNEEDADPNRVSLAGDSSGGNLVAVVSQMLASEKNMISKVKSQVLLYPMLDATVSQTSVEEFATGFGFTKEKINWYFDRYLEPHVDRKDIRISPLFNSDLNGLPKTFIASAGFDPLRDEAELYGEKLAEAGVPTQIKRYPGMIHGFFQMAGVLNQGRELRKDIKSFLEQF